MGLRSAPTLRRLWAAAACLAWMLASSGTILLNKHVMTGIGFRYPTTLAAMGMAASSLGAWLYCAAALPPAHRADIGGRLYYRKILPIGVCMGICFLTGNAGYIFLTVAFIQMLKAFTPVVTMLLLFGAGLERPTRRLCASVTLIAVGVSIASFGELNMSAIGVACILTSVLSESVRLVLSQTLLAEHKLHPIEVLKQVAPPGALLLAFMSWALESRAIEAAGGWALLPLHPWTFALAAGMGFVVNLTSLTAIQMTSSLTVKVLGTFKDVALVLIGIFSLHEAVSATQGVGYSLSIFGFFWYNKIKLAVPPVLLPNVRQEGVLSPLSHKSPLLKSIGMPAAR